MISYNELITYFQFCAIYIYFLQWAHRSLFVHDLNFPVVCHLIINNVVIFRYLQFFTLSFSTTQFFDIVIFKHGHILTSFNFVTIIFDFIIFDKDIFDRIIITRHQHFFDFFTDYHIIKLWVFKEKNVFFSRRRRPFPATSRNSIRSPSRLMTARCTCYKTTEARSTATQ